MDSPTLTVRIGVTPVVGREFYWSITEGATVRSGFVPIDLAGDWDTQADRAVPAGWERLTPWGVDGDHAVAQVRQARTTRAAAARVDTAFPQLRAGHRLDTERALVALFAKMRADVAARHDDGVKRLISARWNKELADLLVEQNMATASDVAGKVADALDSDFNPEVMRGWFAVNGDIAGERINGHTEDDIRAAEDRDDVDDPVGHVFGILETTGALALATQAVTTAAGFGARDAARNAGAAAKSWQVNSGNPRSAHASMNGESVDIDANFSNGMAWPGDPDGGADENANCQCSLTIVK